MLLPGSGSDQAFITSAFAAPLAAFGITLMTPSSGTGYWQLLDEALGRVTGRPDDPGRLLVGGVSLGAHVAVEWAAQLTAPAARALDGLLLALPAWTDRPDGAPAAQAAAASAQALRVDGLATTLEVASAGMPEWLAAELRRAWPAHGAALADDLAAAARRWGPGLPALRGITLPVGLVGLSDDPLHPHSVAREWAAALPRAVLVTTTLAAVGQDRACLGRAALLGWLHARQRPDASPVGR